jgi:membrane protein
MPEEERRLGPMGVVRESVRAWMRHRTASQSAALAFYALVSLAPVLALLLALLGVFFGEELVRERIAREVARHTSPQAAAVVSSLLAGARPSPGSLPTIVEVAAALFGATAVFGQLQDSLNNVWEVAPKPGRWVRNMLRKRLLSFAMVLLIGLVLLVSITGSLVVTALGDELGRLVGVTPTLLRLGSAAASFVLLAAVFAALYRFLPDAVLTWRDVAMGSLVTSLLFVAGKHAIGFWLAHTPRLATAYGAASSLVLLVLWVYYSALLLLFGAELTRVQSRPYHPGGVVPSPWARRLRQSRLVPRRYRREAA